MVAQTESACKGLHKTKAMLKLEEALVSLERMPQLPSVENLIFILHKCRKTKNLEYAHRLLAYMCKSGLEAHTTLENYLVAMFVEVGSMCDAEQVFNRLVNPNEYSWTSLITGYIECGELQHALNLYQKMQEDCVSPNGYTFVALLKACARLKDVETGREIHAEITSKGWERDIFVGNALVHMYGKCGLLGKAQEVFDKLPVRDVVSWTALIAACAEHGPGEEALNYFEQMQLEGVSPNALTLVCSLKACSCIRAIDTGQEIHSEIARMELERDPFVGCALVDMYAKCGFLAKAQQAFVKLRVRDAVSWNALIAGYAEFGPGEEALSYFKQMQLEGISPNALSYVCTLKACGSIGAIDKGREIHAEIARKGLLETEPFVGNALVDMYAKCVSISKAQSVFDELPVRNIVSWNALMTGYTKHGFGEEALNCFEQMQLEGVFPDALTFVCSLAACGCIGDLDKGKEIHANVAKKGWLGREIFVGNALVDMYAKCGSLTRAREVFDKLPVRDAVSWNALIAGYAKHGNGEEALNCFEQMQLEGISLNAITFVCSLKACGSIGAIEKGCEMHIEIARMGLERDLIVGSALVDMYAKCGFPVIARKAFDQLPARNEVSWNALIVGYVEHGFGEKALDCFEQMQLEGMSPNEVTFIYSLKACGSIGAIGKGQEIHAQVTRKGFLDRDPFVGNALVDMYAKCGLLAKAQELFGKLPVRNIVSWTVLMSGHVEHGLGEAALEYFKQMRVEDLSPDAVMFVCSLKACGSIGAIGKGQEIHADITQQGLLTRDPLVGSALLNMYAKCGSLTKAQEVFDKLPIRNVVSWTALIAGYAHLGETENVFYMLERMRGECINPDGVTFLKVLTVCSHAGLVDKGKTYFEAMSKSYGITPTFEHHTCMVDLLSRAGQLDEAVAIIKKMPFHANLVVWHTVLGACRKWGNVTLGKQAFEHAVQLDQKDAAAYVLMRNIYADAYLQEFKKKVEAMRMRE